MPDSKTQNGEPATAVDIPARLFQNNSLVVITKSCWGGGATVKEGDEEIFGSREFDARFFKRGGIVLVGKSHLEPLQEIITRLTGYMGGVGKMFLTRGITIIKNSEWPEISKKIKECQLEMQVRTEAFLANYPDLVAARTEEFDSAHPEHRGRLARYFPDVAELEKSFGIRYVSFAITDASGLEEVFSEERQRLRSVASQYVDSLAQEFRKSILDAVVAFKQSIEKANGSAGEKVNQRSVDGFKNFLERIERNDFLGDKEIMSLMNDLKFGIQRVEDWKVTGGNLQVDEIRKSLEAVIQVASDEGAAISVARGFISSEDIEIEAESPHLLIPVGGFMSMSEEEIETEEVAVPLVNTD
jgi:hypothetical protein